MIALLNEPGSGSGGGLPRLWAGRRRWLLAQTAGVGVGHAALSISLTLTLALALDRVLGETSPQKLNLVPLAAGLASLVAASFALRYCERLLSEKLGQNYVHHTRLRLWRHLERLPATSIVGNQKGATVLRFIGDLTAVKAWVSRGLVGTTVAVCSVVGGLAALTLIAPMMALLAAGALSATFLLQSRLRPVVATRLRALRRQRARLATDIVERVSRLSTIQATNQGPRESRRLRRRSSDVRNAAVDHARASGLLHGSGDGASIALIALLLIIGSTQLQRGALSSGAFVASLVVVRYLARPLRRLSRAQELWLRSRIARAKLESFLALPPIEEPRRSRPLKEGTGVLRLHGVGYGTTFSGLSASSTARARIRLCGTNGVGKSTLLRLVAGLDRPTQGRIGLDGRDLARCRLATIRSAVSLVSPELPLLRGTLKRCISYASPRATSQDLRDVIARVGLDRWISDLPDGLDHRVTDGGRSLSAGQRARVLLARALLARPKVLLLDEVDAPLDARGRETLRSAIDDFDGTVIFVWGSSPTPRTTATWRLEPDGLVTKPLRSLDRARHPSESSVRELVLC